MVFFVKLGFLISLASVVANAATVQGDGIMMVAEVDDGDGAHARESRSPEGLGIPWYLDRINQQEPVLDGEYDTFASATGTGVDIYILADGVEDGDKEFGQGRSRAANIRYIPPFPRWRCTKYGTKIAILTAGNYTGIARNSRIYVLSVTDDSKACPISATITNVAEAVKSVIIRAIINWRRRGRRSVLVMPIIAHSSPALNAIAKEAVDNKIVVVTPAGNWFHDACKYSPGNSPHVINVGSTVIENGIDVLYKTNHGSCVTLYAPGQSNYNEIIGTTQACSIVAGAAALVLEEHPEYSPAKVKRHLIKKAIDGIINMDSVSGDKGANKLLYIGEGLGGRACDGSECDRDGSGGQFSDDNDD